MATSADGVPDTVSADDDGSRAQPPAKTPWHALDRQQVLSRLGVSDEGLSEAQARERRQRFGPNTMPRPKGDSAWVILLRQFHNPLIYVLLASGGLAIVMGKVTDGLVVLGVVVLNAIIGFVQEFRAGKAIEALMGMVPEQASVLRDGRKITLPAEQLVPGDVVYLQSGDKVPADARLLTCKTLKVEEAALTGESVPAEKSLATVEEQAALGDRGNMVFGGTLVTYGAATAVIVGTGADTELGKISAMLRDTVQIETPLMKQLAKVGRWLTVAILLVAAVMIVIGLVRGYAVGDAVLMAITLAVAAIPEGLPAILTIALAIGVRRMAGRNAIIRKLPAVETLGSTTTICSDKTGTLTRNQMTVQAAWTPRGGQHRVTGVGYEPKGKWSSDTGREPGDDLLTLLRAGTLCNDASVEARDGSHVISGDPTEAALVVAAQKAGLPAEATRQAHRRLDAIPFESERQYMATLHQAPGGAVVYLKGAPEVVLRRCPDADSQAVHEAVEAMARHGMRVLALASKPAGALVHLSESDVESGLTLLGLQGMIDPPRPEAVQAIRRCHEAGIVVKMITGDHPQTAQAIGRQIGILQDEQRAVTGVELAAMDAESFSRSAVESNVFARVAPEHKLGLVRALQMQSQVVAMTGDGVNDAPALKQADIGVAMGITGTSVSKEAAAIVLTDDNFASIAAAVEEGRRVYDNLIKALAFVLPTNLGLALILVTAVMFFPQENGQPLMPMLPVQILWINLVATVALALPLAFEAREPSIMQRRPRLPDAPVLSAFVVARTVLVAMLMAAGAIGLFLYEYRTELALGVTPAVALAEAQTMAVTTVILFQIFYLLNCRSLRDSMFKIGLFSNLYVYAGIAALLALQALFIYVPVLNRVFGSSALNADALVKSTLVAAVVLVVIGVEKRLRR